MIPNIKLEIATDVFEHRFKTGAFTEAHTCTQGLGHRARIVDASFDASRRVVVLHCCDPARNGHIAGTDIRVTRTDEKIDPVFFTHHPALDDQVVEALDWLKEDCHHEAAALDRIAVLARYFEAHRGSRSASE